MPRVAIFPDNFAIYRVPAFRAIGEIPEVELTIFSPRARNETGSVQPAEDLIALGEEKRNRFTIQRNRHIYFRKHRIWTVGLLGALVFGRYDIVIVWGEVTNIASWICLILARITGRKVVLWTHGLYGNEGHFKWFFRKHFYDLAIALLLYGEGARDLLLDAGLSKDKLFVIYNSLDYDFQKRIRDSIDWSKSANIPSIHCANENERILLMVGRLVGRRQLEVGLDALKRINDSGLRSRLIVVGDGPMLDSYRNYAEKIGVVEQVSFRSGTFDENELAKYFVSADLGFFPGGVGLFAVHAHAYGLPVCTHDSSISRHSPESEVISPGETGCFFKERDPDDFARVVIDWFASERNRESTWLSCVRRVERSYTPERQQKVFVRLMRYLYGERSEGPNDRP